MVTQEPGKCAGFVYGNSQCPGIVVPGDAAAIPLGVVPDVRGSHSTHRPLHPLPIPVIDKARHDCSTHRGQAVLSVISQVVRANIGDHPGSLAAVTIVRISVAPIRRHCMPERPRPRCAGYTGAVAQAAPGFAGEVARAGIIGVILFGVGTTRPTRGFGIYQAVQGIGVEGLGLRAPGVLVLDPADVSHQVVVVFEVLQGGGVGWRPGFAGR